MYKQLQQVFTTAIFVLTTMITSHAQWIDLDNSAGSLQSFGTIRSLCSDSAGNIYAAGGFHNLNGYGYVAKWDHATNTWSELGGANTSQTNYVSSVIMDVAGNVYVVASTNPFISHVAKWDHTTNVWSELGGPNSLQTNGISTITIDATGNIYAAGQPAGTGGYYYVFRWDHSTNTWNQLGSANSQQPNNPIESICSDGEGNIYAAGFFFNVNGYYYVAKWDHNSNTWSELGGLNGLKANEYINSITSDTAGNIFAVGQFTNTGGYYYVAKWNHTTNAWSELGGDNSLQANASIESVHIDATGNVYAGGYFYNASNKEYVAKWDHTSNSWSELGGSNSLQANAWVYSICSDAAGNTYAAGGFTNGTDLTNGHEYIAKYAPPPISISASQTSNVCAGTSVTFEATVANVTTLLSYQWKVNGNNAGTNSATYTYVPTNNDTVSCVFTTSSVSDTSNSIVIQVVSIVTPTISLNVNPSPTVDNGVTVTFTATTTNGGSTPQYEWLKNGVPISGATGAVWNAIAGTDFSSGDTIAVRLHSNALCASPDVVISKTQPMTIGSTAISNINDGTLLGLYPNPNYGTLVLDGTVKGTGDYLVEITNTLGQKVYEQSIIVTGQKLHTTISLPGLSQGMYFLKIIKDGGVEMIKKFEKVK